MDKFTMHVAPLPRALPTTLPVISVGYLPEKREWMRKTFHGYNFSFLLRGTGRYHTPDGACEIAAPCVFTQWQGDYLEYGPDTTWEEVYLIYGGETASALRGRGFLTRKRRLWYIRDPGPVRHRLTVLRDALDDAAEGAPADRVDHACEGLILESLLCRFPARTDGASQAVEAVRARIEAECTEGPDFDGLALEAGYSPSHLRRLWAEQVGPPPGRYAEEVRMRRARRLLAETDLPVREIATRLGYEDPLYFSRVFRKVVGLPATAYRERHRNELTFGQLQ